MLADHAASQLNHLVFLSGGFGLDLHSRGNVDARVPSGARFHLLQRHFNSVPKGGFKHKIAIVSLVEREGAKRSFHIPTVNGGTLGMILKSQIDTRARLMTDEHKGYKAVGKLFASHEAVNHGAKEYARGDVTSNTVESSFALLKRGLTGTFHSVSEKHLQRYLDGWTRHSNVSHERQAGA
jgi:hypothetical protein